LDQPRNYSADTFPLWNSIQSSISENKIKTAHENRDYKSTIYSDNGSRTSMNENNEILFGGAIRSIPKIPEFKVSEGRAQWFVLLEEAFIKFTSYEENRRLYGDPNKGATLEQAWRTNGLFTGKEPVCLLATGKPAVPTDAIDRVVKLSPKQLTEVLAEMFKLFNKLAFVMFYHDGNMGHCITLLGYDSDTSRFIYHDPWPETSLLCAEYNAAGVDAKREARGWSITDSELERVIFASFVFRNYWAEYMGEKYYINYDEFKHSDFWSFFHITETGSHQESNNNTLITLKTGGFQSEIELIITLNQKKRLVKGELNVKRSWILDPTYGLNPFGLDIVRSFIATLVPPPDQGEIMGLIEMFHKILDKSYAKKLISNGPDDTLISKALYTYLGLLPSFKVPLPFSEISMANSVLNEVEWLQIEISIDAI
jgi:hypothetical protein